jgi:hypothetical protein
MSRAARSVFVFGLYLIVTGVVLFAAPNMILSLIGVPHTAEPWIRVLGLPMGVMGAFHVAAARADLVPFFRFTLWGRFVPLIGLVTLVLLHLAPPILTAFGLVDVGGALWTWAALRK